MQIFLIAGLLMLLLQPLILGVLGVSPSLHSAVIFLTPFLLTINNLRINKSVLKVLYVILFIFIYCYLFSRDLYLIGYINALLLPLLIYVSLSNSINSNIYKKIATINFFFFGCLIFESFIERIFEFKLISIADDFVDVGYEVETQFRSNGLYGHPLSSAGIVLIIYLTILAMTSVSRQKKMYITLFVLASMLCFNARTCLFLTIVGFLCFYLDRLTVKRLISIVVVGIGVLFLLFYAVTQLGVGTRLLELGSDDSSKIRFMVFSVFDYLDVSDLLWGAETSFLDRTVKTVAKGEKIIIENPILDYIFRFGIILTMVLVISYITFFSKISQGLTKRQKIILFVPITISILSSISLAGGSVVLSNLVVMILILKYDSQNNTPLLAIR